MGKPYIIVLLVMWIATGCEVEDLTQPRQSTFVTCDDLTSIGLFDFPWYDNGIEFYNHFQADWKITQIFHKMGDVVLEIAVDPAGGYTFYNDFTFIYTGEPSGFGQYLITSTEDNETFYFTDQNGISPKQAIKWGRIYFWELNTDVMIIIQKQGVVVTYWFLQKLDAE